MFAVFCALTKELESGKPNLDTVGFGYGDGEDIQPDCLLRRRQLTIFETEQAAMDAIRHTFEQCKGMEWTKEFTFVVRRCALAKGGTQ